MAPVISIENISKSYRLGVIGTGTFYGDLKSWWARKRGLPDPNSKVDIADHGNASGSTIWALRDINLEIEQGEAVGIIGRNGAGKSTLLKILSRVTAPTTGQVKIKGRIASLLEVGTGFHPELTGRENIFLNGAIMGMTRDEIRGKFDEIMDFSGVEQFIDTPVKRYSSGMYVRLAFAVAAHLDPDILIVDEVLAVGDANFQKKCLGKMEEVSQNQGRTVLFISHNMGAVMQLCEKALLLQNGKQQGYDFCKIVIDSYMDGLNAVVQSLYAPSADILQDKKTFFWNIALRNAKEEIVDKFNYAEDIFIDLSITARQFNPDVFVGFFIKDILGRKIFTSNRKLSDFLKERTGDCAFRIKIPGNFLVPNYYLMTFVLHIPNSQYLDLQEDVIKLSIIETGSDEYWHNGIDYGFVFDRTEWQSV